MKAKTESESGEVIPQKWRQSKDIFKQTEEAKRIRPQQQEEEETSKAQDHSRAKGTKSAKSK